MFAWEYIARDEETDEDILNLVTQSFMVMFKHLLNRNECGWLCCIGGNMSAGFQPIGKGFGPFVLDNVMVYLWAFVSFHKGNDACNIPYVMFEWEIIALHTKDYLHLISITFYWVSFTVVFLNYLMLCLLYLVTFWRYCSTWMFLKVIFKKNIFQLLGIMDFLFSRVWGLVLGICSRTDPFKVLRLSVSNSPQILMEV